MDEDKIKQKKLYFIVEKLKEFHSKVDVEIQNKIPLEDLIQTGEIEAMPLSNKLTFLFFSKHSHRR